MCGRFSLIAGRGELARRFESDGDRDAFNARHNIASTQSVLTVVGGESIREGLMSWELLLYWAKSTSSGSRMISARTEIVAVWRAAGLRTPSCVIVTTSPNEVVAPIHDRIPVILSRGAESRWLDADVQDAALFSPVLTPYPPRLMEAYDVSSMVNSAANYGPEVVDRSLGWRERALNAGRYLRAFLRPAPRT